MSFSSSTKNEIARMDLDKDCCKLAELSGIIRMNGSVNFKASDRIELRMSTENAATARRTFSIIKSLYDREINVVVKKSKQLKKNNTYLIVVSEADLVKDILKDIGFINDDDATVFNPNYKIDKNIIKKRCCKRAYIRGSFLGGGSVNNPEKSYHLEFNTSSKEHSRDLMDIINSFNLNSKTIKRKDNYVVYIKEANQVRDILNIIGAHQALLKFEDVRILKDVRNNVNRIVNCETANLSKTIDASMRQVENINIIKDKQGLEKLSPKLREVAYLRLENRDASLKEIGEMADPPVGKSGVNYRFKKIEEIANNIKEV